MSPSPSGALGDQQYRQLSMGRMPSMGMGKLESMELPDAVAAVAMLHDMPAEQQRGAAGGGGTGGTSASAQADAAKHPEEDGGGPPASNGLAADGKHVRGCSLHFDAGEPIPVAWCCCAEHLVVSSCTSPSIVV